MKPRAAPLPPLADLDAIPTTLAGAQFRSRLEARWAIWLLEMGILWQYERAPVRVAGRNRWPDFWLVKEQTWLEIKPAGTVPNEELALTIAEQTGSPYLHLAGDPWPGAYEITLFGSADEPPRAGLRWAVGRTDHSELHLCHVGQVWSLRLVPLTMPLEWQARASGGHFPLFDCDLIRSAFRAASGYRFDP